MAKDHQMILLSADLKQVLARLSHKFNAGVAQREERLIRTQQADGSNPSSGSIDTTKG